MKGLNLVRKHVNALPKKLKNIEQRNNIHNVDLHVKHAFKETTGKKKALPLKNTSSNLLQVFILLYNRTHTYSVGTPPKSILHYSLGKDQFVETDFLKERIFVKEIL